jgi:hypothetical protein
MRGRSIGFLIMVLGVAPLMSAQCTNQSAAPQARTAAGTPDFSGVWSRVGLAPGPGSARSLNPTEPPPMTPWAAEKFKAVREGTGGPGDKGRDDLDPLITTCAPPGPTRIFAFPRPFEIVQIPGRVLFLFEWDHWVRPIWTDGRKHPNDPDPTWMGHSIGWWEGDTLVVDTIGLNDKTWIDSIGYPHTEALHIVERYRRPTRDELHLAITIDDPKAYTKPWTANIVLYSRPDWEISEMVNCENLEMFGDKFFATWHGRRPAGSLPLTSR